MALQIANPSVVSKVERLAKRTGLSKTAVVERAVDRLLSETAQPSKQGTRLAALLAQLDRIMALTRDSKHTVAERVERGPAFALALFDEPATLFL